MIYRNHMTSDDIYRQLNVSAQLLRPLVGQHLRRTT